MVLKRKWFILSLLFIECLAFGCPCSITAQSESFPIGLELVYEYSYRSGPYLREYELRYEILSWAPEVGSNIAQIRVTTDGSPEIVYVSTSTWVNYLSNGTNTGQYLYYPLWLNTSTWSAGASINIPTLSRTYELDLEVRRVPAGEYTCWQGSWDYDDELGPPTGTSSILYDQQSEVLIRYHYYYTAYGSGDFISETEELTSSNLADFGFYSNDFYNSRAALFVIVAVLAIAVVIIIIYYLRKDRGYPRGSRPTRPRWPTVSTPDPTPPAPEEVQPEETVFPVEEPPHETSDSPPLEEGALSPCIVCRLPIKPGSLVLGCPHCGGFAHRRHLLEWLKVKSTCPYCHKRLKESQATHIDL